MESLTLFNIRTGNGPGSITRDCRPMQAQALVAYVAKDRLLAFPLSEVVRPTVATGPTPDLVNLCLALSKCLICPSRTSCTAATPPKLSKDHSASARPLSLP